jgi:hypothetical protein
LKEEGRRKREEGRRKREEGRGKKEEGRSKTFFFARTSSFYIYLDQFSIL